MGTILGLRDVADFPTNEREMDWDTVIMRRYPRSNQKAPLTALMSGMKKEATRSAQFHWFDKDSPVRYTKINYATGYATTVTTMVVDSSAPFRAGDLVRNARTDEVMRVTADPVAATEIIVARAWGSSAVAIVDDDDLFVVGTAIMEGASARSSLFTDPSMTYNYTEINRYPLKLTNTAKAEKLRTGDTWKEMRQDAMDQFNTDRERKFIFGVRNQDLTSSEPRRSQGGILYFITTNKTNIADGHLTADIWDTFLMNLFKFGASEKLCLCGNNFLNVINRMIEARAQVNLKSGEEVYGMKVTRYEGPFGDVYFKNHPLLNEITPHGKMGVFVDMRNLKRRYLEGNGENRDVKYLKNRQANDADCSMDEYLVEEGLQLQMEAAHGVLTNVNDYTAA